MSMSCSEQVGIIRSQQKNIFSVEIISNSACSECHANSSCLMMDKKTKIIEVNAQSGYQIGETVSIEITNNQGLQAVLIGYFLPFLLMFLMMALAFFIFQNELIAGIVSILVLIPYYMVLFLLKKTLKKQFQFRLKKYFSNKL